MSVAGTGRAVGTVGRAAGNHPPDLRRGEPAPARSAFSVADDWACRLYRSGGRPIWTHEQMPVMPKGRYKLMTDYMDRVGTMGKSMMYRTCTVQVNLDFASEADMVQKLRVAMALQPVATALFANSPFLDGKPNGHKSWRARIWRDLDAARTGMLPFRVRRRVRVRGNGWITPSMCRCILSIAMANISTPWASLPRFPERANCPPCPAKCPPCRIGPIT
jgi:hypothetical protein